MLVTGKRAPMREKTPRNRLVTYDVIGSEFFFIETPTPNELVQ